MSSGIISHGKPFIRSYFGTVLFLCIYRNDNCVNNAVSEIKIILCSNTKDKRDSNERRSVSVTWNLRCKIELSNLMLGVAIPNLRCNSWNIEIDKRATINKDSRLHREQNKNHQSSNGSFSLAESTFFPAKSVRLSRKYIKIWGLVKSVMYIRN